MPSRVAVVRFVSVALFAFSGVLACSGNATPDVVTPDVVEDTGDMEDVEMDAGPAVTATGGTVDLLHFAVFGDVRPPVMDDTAHYPQAVWTSVVDSFVSLNPQFGVATGDYMFASTARDDIVNAQLDIFLMIESRYSGHVFHALGNHECTGATLSNCMNANETPNIMAFRSRLVGDQPALYYDWTVHTSMGDAHFIVTAPNAWSSSQDAWFTRVMAVDARYTFVIAHEPPTSPNEPNSSMLIEAAAMSRPGGVTLRLFGHSHSGRRIDTNGLIVGNSGAPLDGTNNVYGFAMIDQRADGDIVVTQYEAGSPPMAMTSFVVHPDGTSSN
jgi:hypothetical protein